MLVKMQLHPQARRERAQQEKKAAPEKERQKEIARLSGLEEGKGATEDEDVDYVPWVANKRFEISKFKFEFPRARTYEIIGLVLGCIEAKFCK